MNSTGLYKKSTSHKQFQSKIGLATAKRPGGQTSQAQSVFVDNYATATMGSVIDLKSNSLSDGFVLDGYFLGTFEFDSLTGHPGIRY